MDLTLLRDASMGIVVIEEDNYNRIITKIQKLAELFRKIDKMGFNSYAQLLSPMLGWVCLLIIKRDGEGHPQDINIVPHPDCPQNGVAQE